MILYDIILYYIIIIILYIIYIWVRVKMEGIWIKARGPRSILFHPYLDAL